MTQPAAPHDPPGPGRRARIAAVAATLALAAVLRFVGLRWGLPDVDVRPDESITNSLALGYLQGDLNPHWFGYPTLFSYLVLAGCLALLGWWRLTGAVATVDDFFVRHATDPTAVALTPRLISAAAGTATVWLVYRLARRTLGDRAGLAAAFLMAVEFLPVRDSHFGTTDTTMTALVVLSGLLAWSVYESGALWAYVGSGLALGLAVSTKYTAAPFGAALVAAHLLRPLSAGGRRPHARLVAGIVAAGTAFVLGTPYSVLAPREFLGLLSTSSFAQHLARSPRGSPAWLIDLTFYLPYGLGLPCFAAALAGLPLLAWHDWKKAIVLSAGPLAYFAAVGWSRTTFARYALPLVPWLVIAAAAALTEAGERLASWTGAKGIPASWATAALVAAVSAPCLFDDVGLLRLLNGVDTRAEAAAWMTANLPGHTRVGWMGCPFGKPPLPEPVEVWERRLASAPPRGPSGAAAVARKAELARTRTGGTFELVRLPNRPDRWDGPFPTFLLHELYPIDLDDVRLMDRAAERWVARGPYELVRAWPVTAAGRPIPKPDPRDALYLPYGRLDLAERTGPALYLYRLKTDTAGSRPTATP